MSEKTPRLNPYERPNHFIKQYEQKLGQMSLTDGVPIIHTAPEPIRPDPPDTRDILKA